MKIYKNNCTPSYKRYFFFLKSVCLEITNIEERESFHLRRGHYNQREVERYPENFSVIGEIKEKDIVDLILSKMVKL